MPKSNSVPWTREHMLVALNVYDKLPFGQFDGRTPLIIDIAKRMGRTSGSLSMMLNNFASCDPFHKARGVGGLKGITPKARSMWEEYRAHHDELALTGEELFSELLGEDEVLVLDEKKKPAIEKDPLGPLEKYLNVKVRVGQRYFRQMVLNTYAGQCALTGLNIRSLLVASHIVPWSKAVEHRLDPQNGIALNTLHDKAFDRGLITFDTELRLVCAPSLRDHFAEEIMARNFKAYEGKPLTIPSEAAGPNEKHLIWHREHIYNRPA